MGKQINIQSNDRIREIMDRISPTVPAISNRPVGYSRTITYALESWVNDIRQDKTLSDEKMKAYVASYIDMTYVNKSEGRDVMNIYFSDTSLGHFKEIGEALEKRGGIPFLRSTRSKNAAYNMTLIIFVALEKLADEITDPVS